MQLCIARDLRWVLNQVHSRAQSSPQMKIQRNWMKEKYWGDCGFLRLIKGILHGTKGGSTVLVRSCWSFIWHQSFSPSKLKTSEWWWQKPFNGSGREQSLQCRILRWSHVRMTFWHVSWKIAVNIDHQYNNCESDLNLAFIICQATVSKRKFSGQCNC